MKRRQFIKLALFSTTAAALPLVALASGKPPVDQISYADLVKVREIMDAAAVPDPYIVVHPENLKRIKSVHTAWDGTKYEGFTWVEMPEIMNNA